MTNGERGSACVDEGTSRAFRRHHRVSCVALVALLTLGLTAESGRTQTSLPPHAAIVAGQHPVNVVSSRSDDHLTFSGFGVSLLYCPLIDDRRFADALGVQASYDWPSDSGLVFRLSAGYEAWNIDVSKGKGLRDASIVPLGVSLLHRWSVMPRTDVAIEGGLRYLLVDFEDAAGDYSDAVTALFGGGVMFVLSPGIGVGMSAGYQLAISPSENDAGDKFAVDVLQLRLVFAWSL